MIHLIRGRVTMLILEGGYLLDVEIHNILSQGTLLEIYGDFFITTKNKLQPF